MIKKSKKTLPDFKSAEEEARYWDKHSVTEHLDELEEIDDLFILSPRLVETIRERTKKKLISLRLPNWQIEKSRQIAKKKRMPYQTLMQKWINDGLRGEALAILQSKK